MFSLLFLAAVVTVTQTQLACTFEQDLCDWTQVASPVDERDWTRHHGETPSFNAGPSVDHTLVNTAGYYIYLEASDTNHNDRAQLMSPTLTNLTQCLTFWYHMHGLGMGSLNVYTTANGANLTSIWTRHGPQGDHWLAARMPIPPSAIGHFKIVLEAVSKSYWSDIAVDDVILMGTSCSELGHPSANTTTGAPTTATNRITEHVNGTTESPPPTSESLPLDVITVGGEEYIKLPKPCNILEHLCPITCYMQMKKLDGGSHCFHCVCTGQGGTILVG